MLELVLVVGCGGLVAMFMWANRQRKLYPGSLEDTYGKETEDERRELSAARGILAALEDERRTDADKADAAVTRAKAEYGERVRRAQAAVSLITRAQAWGSLLRSLGAVHLYDQVVVVDGTTVPLDGLDVTVQRLEIERNQLCLQFVNGADWAVHTYEVPETAEVEIRAFSTQIISQAAIAPQRAAERQARLDVARAELRKTKADSSGIRRAEAACAAVTRRHAIDPRVPAARQALDDRQDAWEDRTGHRPPDRYPTQ
ncbi:hypothetical protein [Streptomyces sp. SM12]|uniref:hypothetical protein n=1 Tax=Streptomyces sp. SM12 TaxID=1071602 RepID=UPI000CD5C9A6|nr:hypothetical protein [Streptomyces sp. SM12]